MDIFSSEQALLLFSCFIFSCFILFLTSRSKQNSRKSAPLPPGPPRLPIIGNIHQVGNNPHQSFADLSKTYGPVMSLKFGSLNTVVISSRDAAREVLKTHDQVLSARYFSESARFIKHSDFSFAWLHPSSDGWRKLRKLSVNQLFSPQPIDASKDLRKKKVQELVNFMSKASEREEVVDISSAAFVTILNIISNLLFSVDLGSYDPKNPNVFQDIVTVFMESMGKPDLAMFYPFLRNFDIQGNRKKLTESTEKMFTVFRGFYDTRIAENSSRKGAKDASSRDFVDTLVDLLAQEGEGKLNTDEIDHLLLDLFTAGTDTSSTIVEWALVELIRKPEKMKKVQDEIAHVIGQNGIVEESDISELPYLQAVIKETFRLHPSAPLLLPRKAEADVEILGFLVPKGTQIHVNAWAVGRDPEAWENPTQFEPERFLGKDIDVKGKDYGLIPFGAGRRICPGMSLSSKSVPLMLASLLYFFEWRLPNGVVPEDLDMEESFGLTLHKTNPLHAVPIKKIRH